MNKSVPSYKVTHKEVGETPLVALEKVRSELKISATVPLAYAGRLDPMASGKLLVLIGSECKVQEKYHALDKEYEVEILLGVSSDTGDVLGLVTQGNGKIIDNKSVFESIKKSTGHVSLPYPLFSSKTVKGKPLHTWTLEKRLDEIEIPQNSFEVYANKDRGLRKISKEDLIHLVLEKINSIPKVTDERKVIGADFRREDVRKTWEIIRASTQENYQVISFTCICSSGSYMRSLSEDIARKLGTTGIALSIHRTKIGKYFKVSDKIGFWLKQY